MTTYLRDKKWRVVNESVQCQATTIMKFQPKLEKERRGRTMTCQHQFSIFAGANEKKHRTCRQKNEADLRLDVFQQYLLGEQNTGAHFMENIT